MRSETIKVEPFTTMVLKKCNILKTINEHFIANIEGIIGENEEELALKCNDKTQININVIDEEGGIISIFRGLVQHMDYICEAGIHKLSIAAASYTCLLETEKKIRPFQREHQTFKEVVGFIASENDNVSVIYSEGKTDQVGGIVVQYCETDWEFLKRMAARLNTVIVADCNTNHTCFFFGIPEKKEAKIEKASYSTCNGKYGPEFTIESREILQLCAPISFNQMNLYLYKIESYIRGSELIHQYTLRPKSGFRTEKYENDKIIGASLLGYVKKVRREQVQIKMSYDSNTPSEIDKWFTFATVYSSPDGTGWYCMPEEGDQVRLCFPDSDERNAYAASAYHCSEENGLRDDPDNKFIRTVHNKEIRLTPDRIQLTNHKGLTIILDDKEGISIKSNRGIKIESASDITMVSGEQINIEADGGIILRENNSSITIKNGIRQNGISVRYQ